MVLFELLQLFLIFLDYLRIKYLWHVLIMPLTNRNGISPMQKQLEGLRVVVEAAAVEEFEAYQGAPRHALQPL